MSARKRFPTGGLCATYCRIGTAFAIGFSVCASAAPAFASEEQIGDARVASVCSEDLFEEDGDDGRRSGCAGTDDKQTPHEALRENREPLADIVAVIGEPSSTPASHEEAESRDQDFANSRPRRARELPKHVTFGYAVYDDSDDNRRSTRSLSTDISMGDVVWNAYLGFAAAEDDVRDHGAIILGARIDSPMGKRINVSGGVGLTQLRGAGVQNVPTGHIALEGVMQRGTVGMSLARLVLVDTAEIIENRIKVAELGLKAGVAPTDRLSFSGGTVYRNYSDNNASWDLRLRQRFAIRPTNPRIDLGYRYEQRQFDQQTGSGYFDPDELASHLIYAAAAASTAQFSGNLELFVGRQSSDRFDEESNESVGGFHAKAEYSFAKHFALLAQAEGGNFALENASGFRYYQLNVSLVARY